MQTAPHSSSSGWAMAGQQAPSGIGPSAGASAQGGFPSPPQLQNADQPHGQHQRFHSGGGGGESSLSGEADSSHSPGKASKDNGGDQNPVRAYRSRKDRPCDTCRLRKGRCIIEEVGKPCQTCTSLGKKCTFDIRPTPRSRPPKPDSIALPPGHLNGQPLGSPSSSFDTPPYPGHGGRVRTTSVTESSSPSSSGAPHLHRFAPYPNYSPARSGSVPRRGGSESYEQPFAPPQPGQLHHNLAPPPGATFAGSSQAQLPPGAHFRRPAAPQPQPGPPRRMHPGAQDKATTAQLHDLVLDMIQGEASGPSNSAGQAGSAAGDDEVTPRAPAGDQSRTPFVIGSSSSDDPMLLNQTGAARRMRQKSQAAGASSAELGRPGSSTEGDGDGSQPGTLLVRQVTQDPKRPVFFAFFEANPYGLGKGKAAQIGAEEYQQVRAELGDRAGPLMVLYSLRDSAAFPMLTTSQRRGFRMAAASTLARPGSTSARRTSIASEFGFEPGASANVEVPLPPALANATLASAMVYDENLRSLGKQAWGFSLASLHDLFDYPSLMTLQTAILDLSGRPSINQFGNSMTLARTITLAFNLGLHMSPVSWSISPEERDVRIRLWAGLLIHDTLSAFCWGRPMMVHGSSDHNVPLPKRHRLSPSSGHIADSEPMPFCSGGGAGPKPEPHDARPPPPTSTDQLHTPGDTFVALCSLCVILSDILLEFHAVRRPVHDPFNVSIRVKKFLTEIEDWKCSQPPSLRLALEHPDSVDPRAAAVAGTRSLQLTTHGIVLSLCRTTLDAHTIDNDEHRGRYAAKAALQACKLLVQWLESLTANDFGGYWMHYGSHHMASCVSMLARLALGFARVNDDVQLNETADVLQRIIMGLSDAKRFHKWDLAELGLARARPMLNLLESRIKGFPKLGPLLAGHSPSSMPFDGPDPRSQTPRASGNAPDVAPQSLGALNGASNAWLQGAYLGGVEENIPFDVAALSAEGILTAGAGGSQQLLPDVDWMSLNFQFQPVGGAGGAMTPGDGLAPNAHTQPAPATRDHTMQTWFPDQ